MASQIRTRRCFDKVIKPEHRLYNARVSLDEDCAMRRGGHQDQDMKTLR